jgi:hypothetical protein
MAPKMSKHVPRLTAGEFLELMDEVIYPEDNTTPARPWSTRDGGLLYSRTPAASNAY